VRRPPERLGQRFARAVDTDPIDLRDIRRAAPPRGAVIHQPFAGGARPDPPVPAGAVQMLGAPIPEPDVADPDPYAAVVLRRPVAPPEWWTPRRRRRQLRLAAVLTGAGAAVVLVVTAAVSAFGAS
jgi:hypothetical protein